MNAINRFGLAALSAALLGGAVFSYAASDDGNPPPPQHQQGQRPERGGPMKMLRELNLTEQQQQQLKQFRESQKAASEANRTALRNAHTALEAAENQPGTDAAKLRSLADTEGKAAGDSAYLRAQFKQKLLSILTPEQKTKLQSLEQQHRQHGPRDRPGQDNGDNPPPEPM